MEGERGELGGRRVERGRYGGRERGDKGERERECVCVCVCVREGGEEGEEEEKAEKTEKTWVSNTCSLGL